MDIPPTGMEMGQLAKKLGEEKRNEWIAGHLPQTKLIKNFKELNI